MRTWYRTFFHPLYDEKEKEKKRKTYIYIYIYIIIIIIIIIIIPLLVVTKSLCGFVAKQVQYNMESAQYLG